MTDSDQENNEDPSTDEGFSSPESQALCLDSQYQSSCQTLKDENVPSIRTNHDIPLEIKVDTNIQCQSQDGHAGNLSGQNPRSNNSSIQQSCDELETTQELQCRLKINNVAEKREQIVHEIWGSRKDLSVVKAKVPSPPKRYCMIVFRSYHGSFTIWFSI